MAHESPEEHGSHVIVASEPSTYNSKEWGLIEKNHGLMTEKLEYPKEWNATMN